MTCRLWTWLGLVILGISSCCAPAQTVQTPPQDLRSFEALSGEWKVHDNVLSNVPGKASKVSLGEISWPAYVISLTVKRTEGDGGLDIAVPAGEHQVILRLDIDKEQCVLGATLKDEETHERTKPLGSTSECMKSLLSGTQIDLRIRYDGKQIRVSACDSTPLTSWTVDAKQLTQAKGNWWLAARQTNAAWTIQDVRVERMQSEEEKQALEKKREADRARIAAEKKQAQTNKSTSTKGDDAGAPTEKSKWAGSRSSVTGPDIAVSVTIVTVADDRVIIDVLDVGDARWRWSMKRNGERLEVVDIVNRGGANGRGRDVEISDVSGSGTMSASKISIDYRWRFRAPKRNGVNSGTLVITPD